MIIAGLKLTILGMGVVTIFLLILVLIVSISSRLLGEESTKERIKLERTSDGDEKEGHPARKTAPLLRLSAQPLPPIEARGHNL